MASGKISVIIPTKDRPQDLARCLESISQQTLLPDELIIVDASSTETLLSPPIAQINQKIKTLHLHTAAGLTHQRNVGVEASSGDIVFFLDDDVVLEKDFIKEIVNVFNQDKEGKVAGVCGRIIAPETRPQHGWLVNSLLAAYYAVVKAVAIIFLLQKSGDGKFRASGFASSASGNQVRTVESMPGGLTAWRKEIFSEFRFDEQLQGYGYMEDDDFSYRVSRKYVNIYTPHARLLHNPSPVARDKSFEISKMLIENHYYLFKKNLPQTLNHKLAFYWSLIGLGVRGTLQAVVAGDIGVLKGIIAGLVSIKKGKGVPTHGNAHLENA